MTLAARARAWLPVLPLLAILSMTYWLDRQAKPESAATDPGKQHTPDAIIDRLHAVTLSLDGTPHFIMSARQLVHYADDDSTLLEQPDLTAITPQHPDIHMTSQHGRLSSKGDVVELMDDVRIVRAASAANDALLITSDYVQVVPAQQTAQTPRAVTVEQGGARLSAVGMELDYRAQNLKLLSRVKATHVLPQN